MDERTRETREIGAELDAFTYTVSHDLRAPLRALQGFTRALLEDCLDRLGPDGQGYAHRIAGAAGQMDHLIQDLLAYSRLTRAALEPRAVRPAALVEELVRELDGELRARGGRVEVQQPLPTVLADRGTLRLVLAHLLSNAAKFVPPDASPQVRVRGERARGWVRLWVEDEGIGIAPEHHERIFRVFERLHGAEAYTGSGIGLAIVRRGVERMGGRAGVQSERGGGSRFWVELRAAEDAT